MSPFSHRGVAVRNEVNNISLRDEKSLLRHFRESWLWILAGSVFSFEFASVLVVGWPTGFIPNLRLPYLFATDALLTQWEAKRAIEGWIFNNPRSGFPFGSELYDYPNSDAGSFLIYKVLGNLTHSVFPAFDLYL